MEVPRKSEAKPNSSMTPRTTMHVDAIIRREGRVFVETICIDENTCADVLTDRPLRSVIPRQYRGSSERHGRDGRATDKWARINAVDTKRKEDSLTEETEKATAEKLFLGLPPDDKTLIMVGRHTLGWVLANPPSGLLSMV
jgi:hypothetical protein